MSVRARVALKVLVWVVALSPLAALLYRFWTDDLTANPISYVTNELGQTALRLLLASLALTPLRLVFGIGWQMTLRRLLGLFAFFYVCLHLGVWLVLVDRRGIVRYRHIGEGDYETTEAMIRRLLGEQGWS